MDATRVTNRVLEHEDGHNGYIRVDQKATKRTHVPVDISI